HHGKKGEPLTWHTYTKRANCCPSRNYAASTKYHPHPTIHTSSYNPFYTNTTKNRHKDMTGVENSRLGKK
ncbi:Hypothetical predicted protein, partial [Pelobates cultripes]